MRFEWDGRKAASNAAKHGVSFQEASTVLADPLGWTYPDGAHSRSESRWVTVGMSGHQRLLVVAHLDEEETDHQRAPGHCEGAPIL